MTNESKLNLLLPQRTEWLALEKLLREFLSTDVSSDRTDLLNGRPCRDNQAKRTYFRFSDLHVFLQEKRATWSKPRIIEFIRVLGGSDERLTEPVDVHVWWLPAA